MKILKSPDSLIFDTENPNKIEFGLDKKHDLTPLCLKIPITEREYLEEIFHSNNNIPHPIFNNFGQSYFYIIEDLIQNKKNPKGIITDNAINIVFENTNFGKITAREVVEENLLKVKQGWAIGHTAKCCLVELGLIYETTKRNLVATKVGDRYLEILINE